MNRIIAACLLSATMIAPASAFNLIASSHDQTGAIIAFSDKPCSDGEPGFEVYFAPQKGKTHTRGCYEIYGEKAAIRWQDHYREFQQVNLVEIQPGGYFKGWPEVSWENYKRGTSGN